MAKTEGTESEHEPQDGSTALSKADQMRQQLKVIANQIAVNLAPIAATTALALAILALVVTKSTQTQSGDASGKLEKMNASLNTSLNASKIELEKLKTELAQEKSLREEQQKQQNDLIARIVPAVSQLQGKLKIAPTLAEQLQQPAASAPAAATMPVPASAPAAPQAQAPAPAKAADKKTSPQMQSLKEALDKFNKQ